MHRPCARRNRLRLVGPALLALALWPGGAAPMPQRDDGVVRFTYPDTAASAVFLSGDFNGWNETATPLDREAGGFSTRVFLDPGTYEYTFVVDGVARRDSDNPEYSPRGTSIVRVGADGEVLPPRPTAAEPAAGERVPSAAGEVRFGLRYLGTAIARREDSLGRYELQEPAQDVDLRLDAQLTDDLAAFVLATMTNRASGDSLADLSMRYDRGQIDWRPGHARLRLFDNVGVGSFDDPGNLVGRVGIYADEFGYRQRGLAWRQRIFAAPIDLLYTDDSETGSALPPPVAAPGEIPPPIDASTPNIYTTNASHRGADVLAGRLRSGTDALGLGVGLRLDRGRNRGQAYFLSGDSLQSQGQAYETAERWAAWAIDARGRWRMLRLAAEYMAGAARADAQQVRDVQFGDSTVISSPRLADAAFAIDRSRRAVVEVGFARDPARVRSVPAWSARPGTGELGEPRFGYEYEEHDFTALVSGAPFLTRRHTLSAGIDGEVLHTTARLDLEQHWFRYPSAATWETQFWFRRHNGWLDEDVVSVERATLLGAPAAAVARLHLERALWEARGWQGELHATWAAPGFDEAPRYGEGILRLAFPLHANLRLRTHSRLAVYRQFETEDSGIQAALGPGSHFDAGEMPFAGDAPVAHSYRAFSAHYVELVYAITSRSDVSIGFGVDPEVVYEKTNEFAPVGWDAFLFGNGLDAASLADPLALGGALEQAEAALEGERRLQFEARLRF